MSYRPRIPSLDDHYCQVCSSSPTSNKPRHLSCFFCEHCRSSMCYECFEKHTSQLIDEFTHLQQRYSHLQNLFDNKQQFLGQYQEHCLRSVNSAFDEAVNDLENLRRESINYVKQQFNDAEIILSEMMTTIKPLISKAQQSWTREGITKSSMLELEIQRQQINDIERRLDIFSSPKMQIKMSTYPRNKLDLHCQLLSNLYTSTKKFSATYPGKSILTRCLYGKLTELQSEKIDVETEVEELNQNSFMNKQIQTDPLIGYNYNIDYRADIYSQDETDQMSDHLNTENSLSTRFIQQSTILTENEVDRIASDGEHLLYFSDTSNSLGYITNLIPTKEANSTSITKEISCRWPYYPILDIVYSPTTSQFICATKAGVYTCTIVNSTIDIQMQLTQNWSYVRLAADNNYIWIWTDTPRLNQLSIYTPRTFNCIKVFNLNEYPRFLDNSTSFCIHSNILATLFQFRPISHIYTYRKIFNLTLCDSIDLHELCTIRLGECDIDHEIRVNNNGLFFITNGRKTLWIVDQHGRKEYVPLYRIGRALTIHARNNIIIANGTQQLQCIELIEKD
ncbi:unnamed protein product [Rotaria sp. Silwood2]|nr:unnamed protein product [Rotaria sp. Silwood2]CAF3160323.1 unnamed protein product [Rotaria sp. Silwood2]CAF3936442.1 unnamed protein product [Rotaria sp. Silwood2]CAF4147791.1 unnamed protein product [Rotaria sp. Silwood2]